MRHRRDHRAASTVVPVRHRGDHRLVLLVGTGLALLVLVPWLAAATSRPDDRTLLGAYAVTIAAVASMSVAGALFLAWEIARQRRHRSPVSDDHGEPSGPG